MPKRPLDPATIQTYLESLSEAEVTAIFETVRKKMKRRWDYRSVVFLALMWCVGWIWSAGTLPVSGLVVGFAAMLTAAAFLWPSIRWLQNRALKDEVNLRINANGV
jgi:hypothetical protein